MDATLNLDYNYPKREESLLDGHSEKSMKQTSALNLRPKPKHNSKLIKHSLYPCI